jgi:predicted DsbA family dithiol-disulfide isomerase
MVVHPNIVMEGHLGGCAASKQGKFNEFKHAFWDKAYAPYAAGRDPSKLGGDNLEAVAKGVGLDTAKFKADMKSEECQQRVQGDMAELNKWRVNSTPSFFVNGVHFGWNGDPAAFKQVVDENIKKVEQSGVPCGEYYDREVIAKGEKQFRSKKDAKR